MLSPPLLIISAVRVPTAMPRRSAAADVSVGAIRTLPSRPSRLLAAVSSWSFAAASAAAAAAAGPSPCRS